MPRIKPRPTSDFEVRESTIPGAGLGLFARVPIGLEETIGYYSGDLITWDQLAAGTYSGSRYIFAISRKMLVVAEGPNANPTRYINHSAEPNAFAVVSTRWKTVRIEAVQPIAPGEEIFLNYGDQYWG
jgi:SET domain-containing protein